MAAVYLAGFWFCGATRASKLNMVLMMQIVVFKCKVNVCDQDLGAFCREWDPKEEERLCSERAQATLLLAEEVLEELMEMEEPPVVVVCWLGVLALLALLALGPGLGSWVCPWKVVSLWDRLWSWWGRGQRGPRGMRRWRPRTSAR